MTEKNIKLKTIENLNAYYKFKNELNKLTMEAIEISKMIYMINNNIQIVHQRINTL
jgi:archaellum component FlaC